MRGYFNSLLNRSRENSRHSSVKQKGNADLGRFAGAREERSVGLAKLKNSCKRERDGLFGRLFHGTTSAGL